MATWRYFSHLSSDGQPVGELPLRDVSIEDVLSGGSSLSARLGLYDEKAARTYCAPWLREITAVRDTTIAFHGPVMLREPSRGGRTVEIRAASPHAYLFKRVTEALRHYSRDQFSIVRGLVSDATAKTGGRLYRLNVTSGNSGITKELLIGGMDRRRVSDVIEELSADPDTGFDFRWDYSWHSQTDKLVTRTLTLGYPNIGRDLTATQVIQATPDLVDVTDTEDGALAANRVHGLGATVGKSRLRSVANSGASLNAGYPLLEDVVDLSGFKRQAPLDLATTTILRARRAGAHTIQTTHTIGAALPYGAVDLGDTVTVRVSAGVEQVDLQRRVISIRTTPATDEVTFVYFDPATQAL